MKDSKDTKKQIKSIPPIYTEETLRSFEEEDKSFDAWFDTPEGIKAVTAWANDAFPNK